MKFRYTGIAVVSWGDEENNRPDVYSRISPKIKAWIEGKASGAQSSDCSSKKSKKCKPYWARFGGTCYRKVSKKMRYSKAKDYCKRLNKNANLASVSYNMQIWFLLSLLNQKKERKNNLYFWIGGTDKGKEGKWKWEDKTPWKYKNWLRGEPDNKKSRKGIGQNCLEMRGSDGQWRDEWRWKERAFFCQYTIGW